MGDDYSHDHELLSPLEQHIVELVEELSSAIAGLGGDDDEAFPLAEFDQRLLLEHAQLIQRYVLAQAAARAYPDRYRLIGSASPRTESEPVVVGDTHNHSDHGDHDHANQPSNDHPDHGHSDHDHPGHDHADNDATLRHYVADPDAAREAHRQGRAIIGEHPWEHEHDHGDDHNHADEWDWEPMGNESPPA